MTVSLSTIRANRGKGRAAERYALPVVLCRAISVYLTYLLVRLRVKPDEITFTSIAMQFVAAAAFVLGAPLAGAILFQISFLLDCSDGEVARVVGRTKHGAALDSMGADSFYALSLTSIAYYLFSEGLTVGSVEPRYVLLTGACTSLAIMLSRVVEIRNAAVRRPETPGSPDSDDALVSTEPHSLGHRLFGLYRNWPMRQNFFAEPGIVLIVLVLVASGAERWVTSYLLVLAAYHVPNMLISFVAVYWRYARRGAPSDLLDVPPAP